MATSNPELKSQEAPSESRKASESIGSRLPPVPPNPSLTGGIRTEKPVEPEHVYQPFTTRTGDEAIIGNVGMIFTQRREGRFGIFFKRRDTMRVPTPIYLDCSSLRAATEITLCSALERLMLLNQTIDTAEIDANAHNYARQLTQGVMIMTYLKLRMTNYHDPQFGERFYNKPKVPLPFEVPRPYALALSQLGQIKVSGLAHELYLTPSVLGTDAADYCLSSVETWSPTIYARAVEFAKKSGMRFTTVDLSVKMGSSWWLFRPEVEGSTFSLVCPIPEENFTKSTAVLHSLFCVNSVLGFYNPMFDLTPLGTESFGTMFRGPPDRVDLSTFFAVDEEVEVVWRMV